MVSWNTDVLQSQGTFLHPLELLTGPKPRTSLPSIPQGNSTTREHHETLIKKQQMDISEELSISTYVPGQTVWCFDTLNKIWKPAVILEPVPEPHSYWCRSGKFQPETQKNTTLHQAILEYNRV